MEWMPGWGSGTLCLFGFEVGETVAWEVYDAAGVLAFSGSSEVEPASDGPTFLAVDLTTKTYSPGEWTIRAMAPSGEMNGSFPVGDRETAPYVELKVEESTDVIANGRDRNNLVEGDVLLIRAVYLPATAPIAVGIYYIVGSDTDGEHLRLMNSAVFASSEEGRLEFSITIDRSDKPGTYALVVSSASDYAPSGMPDVKGATDTFGVAAP